MKRLLAAVVVVAVFITTPMTTIAEEDLGIDKVTVHQSSESFISSVVSDDVKIDNVFGGTQCIVDAQIYEGMKSVCSEEQLISTFGRVDTDVFKKACETMNPCMAFATSKGEAGGKTSEPGISMTTVIATNDRYYNNPIDWVYVTSELSQVDEMWYYTNCDSNTSNNSEYNSYLMPISYLQNGGSNSLGIGPYQITSSDWDTYTLEDRVSPTKGWQASLKKGGTSWLYADVSPISDITIMAMLSMNHQGGSIITSDCGISIINAINDEYVQDCLKQCAYKMYEDVYEKANSGQAVCADDINPSEYISDFYEACGIKFNQWSYGKNKTNTGGYVIRHTMQYMFYKYYFGLEDYDEEVR